MASSYVGGLSGAFIPVSEDKGMIDTVNAGSLCIEKLEAMTCVCSVGLDMIAIPVSYTHLIFAGKDSLHDLSNYHQRRIAGIIVYIFKAHVNCMLVIIFQYFQLVACFLEGWLNQ